MIEKGEGKNTERLARFMKVLGDANRLGIALSVGTESRSVTEIINDTGLSQTLVSFHLRIMREADIVRTKRNGPFIHYSLSDPLLLEILSQLSGMINGKRLRAGRTVESAKGTTLKARRK